MSNIRSFVVSNAWKIHRKGLSWSYAMKKAWEISQLKAKMKEGETTFVYIKTTTGQVRIARAKKPQNYSFANNPSRPPSKKVIRYFDLDREEWRSFRPEHLLETF
jgi:hypothetical protein